MLGGNTEGLVYVFARTITQVLGHSVLKLSLCFDSKVPCPLFNPVTTLLEWERDSSFTVKLELYKANNAFKNQL